MSTEFQNAADRISGLNDPEQIDSLKRWLLDLAAGYNLFAPSGKSGNRILEGVSAQEELDLTLRQDFTILPAKKAFIPPTEILLQFRNRRVKQGPEPGQKAVIFGLHVCELSADRLLTAVLESGWGDYPFQRRRRGALTIGAPCQHWENCFCEKTGHDIVAPGQYDLFLTVADDGSFVLLAGSEEGRTLATDAPFSVQDPPDTIAAPRPSDGAGDRWPLDEMPELMRSSFGATMWEELAARCLGCGNCTVVCPLCYCFYTRDETGLDPSAGTRLRQWDSCQLVAFARVAGGHNFREARSERIWYRFSHKFMRMQEGFGQPGCSGCGACFHYCPVDIDPRKVIDRVLEANHGHTR